MKALDLDFIKRVKATSAVLAILLLLFVSVYFDWKFGLGLFIGMAWGIANLHFLTELVLSVVTHSKPSKKKIILLALAKFPLLYGAAFLIITQTTLPGLAFVIGFTLVFAVILLKVLGRLLDERLRGKDSSENLKMARL